MCLSSIFSFREIGRTGCLMATFPMAVFVLQAISALHVPPDRMINPVEMEHTILIPGKNVVKTVRHVMVVVSVMEKVLLLLMVYVALAGTVKAVPNHQRQTMVKQGIYALRDTTARLIARDPENVYRGLTG